MKRRGSTAGTLLNACVVPLCPSISTQRDCEHKRTRKPAGVGPFSSYRQATSVIRPETGWLDESGDDEAATPR